MEKQDSVAQEITNGVWECDKVNWATSYSYVTPPDTLVVKNHCVSSRAADSIVIKADANGNVVYFDKEGFLELVSKSTDPVVKSLGIVYELGFLEGMKA